MKSRSVASILWLILGSIGVFALWQDVDGLPDEQTTAGWLLAGTSLVVYLFIWLNRALTIVVGAFIRGVTRRSLGAGASAVDQFLPGVLARPQTSAAAVLLSLAYAVLAIVTTGLVTAINPLFGAMALASLIVASTMDDFSRWTGGRVVGFAYIMAGAMLLFLGGIFALAYRQLQEATGEGAGFGVGAALALLGPGLRNIAEGVGRNRGPLIEISGLPGQPEE